MGSRYFFNTGSFQSTDIRKVIKTALPVCASKVPEPPLTEKVETFKVNVKHARKDLVRALHPAWPDYW